MARQAQVRRSPREGRIFALLMLVIMLFVVLLMWYFKDQGSSQALPQRPPGLVYRF